MLRREISSSQSSVQGREVSQVTALLEAKADPRVLEQRGNSLFHVHPSHPAAEDVRNAKV